MPTTLPRQLRLTDQEWEALGRLAAAWGGPVRPLSRTEVVRELVRRAAGQETKKSRRTKEKGQRANTFSGPGDPV
jgi:hypothetical protein